MMLAPPRKATVVRRFFFEFRLPRDRKRRATLTIAVLAVTAVTASSIFILALLIKNDAGASPQGDGGPSLLF
ncbi:hypothetical protein EJ076_26315 [Mesorhizobium sp. M7D.F.Ca.US.005.01.1.1]|uniref:hypothetical protein n=1 Tax=Mesorhizobium sp. M7D.F.Ca.US.005.01.1.1 TaxID=2493678 RepID=UPI000F7653D0|nr:hypothetical protein [Mesorhizobium sp. M7D.F.Ca.US.005.01.1.1]AZO44362.1 hypothetical protein EJ076_26315 [Mesorhizobium sp. M7D.F.Ca.US.005.01.1.1]